MIGAQLARAAQPANALTAPTCALCGWRPGTRSAVVSYRVVPACRTCKRQRLEVPDVEESAREPSRVAMWRTEVATMLRRRPGSTAEEIAEVLEIGSDDDRAKAARDRNAFGIELRRMAARGVLERRPILKTFRYWITGDTRDADGLPPTETRMPAATEGRRPIYLSRELHARVKAHAAREGMPLAMLAEQLMGEVMNRIDNAEQLAREVADTATATDSPAP